MKCKKMFLVLVAMLSLHVIAQNELTEGVMMMKMTMDTDNEQAKAALAMMGDMTVTTYFKDNKSRTEQSHQMTGSNITIVDNEAKKLLVLMENPMLGKKFVKQDILVSEEDIKNVKVNERGDTKTIAGYICKGYDVTVMKDGVENKMVMYVTDKIAAPNQNTAGLGDKIKGFPLYMVMNTKQGPIAMQITMEVTEVREEKVDDGQIRYGHT